jgi:hypothetical protein
VNPEDKTDAWDFDYAPIPIGGGDEQGPDLDLLLATSGDIDPALVVEVLAGAVPDVEATPVFSGHPVFWTRVRSSQHIDRRLLKTRLEASGVGVRYVVSARRGSQRLPPRLDCSASRPRRPQDWKARESTTGAEPDTPWRWFLRSEGANVVRLACGTGSGSRIAVIDNDGLDLHRVDLDAEVLVGVGSVPRAAAHAAMMIGWAVGASNGTNSRFRGVAPDASVRFFCIPKGSGDILSLPLAIVRAVDDGADVIVCATYVEGQTSPLLDDALEFAWNLGRGGRGTAIVFPTGREMSSPAGSIHSSLSLGMADPASDPRVFCVGPSARSGEWFLWRDRRGKLRPFANRGPAIRWLAPGDDMAHPFYPDDRPGHAESSGASGIAAGVLALVLACNPELTLVELEALLRETAVSVDPSRQANDAQLADRNDLLPPGTDADGHNAKHGYGRLDAGAACLACRDPIAFALLRVGEHDAALWCAKGRADSRNDRPYGEGLGRWVARVMLRDSTLSHACCSLARACRLRAATAERGLVEPAGYLVRQLGIIVRLLIAANPPQKLLAELHEMDRSITDIQDADALARVDSKVMEFAMRAFAATDERRSTSRDSRSSGTRPATVASSAFPIDAYGTRSS